MKIAVFSTRSYDREFLSQAAATDAAFNLDHQFFYYDVHLRPETVQLAKGHDAICVFVNDQLDRATLERLKAGGVQLIALRCAGYNNVDLTAEVTNPNYDGIALRNLPFARCWKTSSHLGKIFIRLTLSDPLCSA
jgi:lactate dehydrogenase-like 2-hydroxyacid dehydrogenase